MILGHAALAVVAKKTIFRPVLFSVLVLATYGPDLIDKAGMVLFSTSSKGIGHTLVTFAGLALLVSFSPARRWLSAGVWRAAGLLWLSHLVLDLTEPAVLFWPLFGPLPVTPPYDLSEGFVSFYTGHGDHVVLALDLACLAAAAAVTLRARLKTGKRDS